MGDTGKQDGAAAAGPTATPKKRKPRAKKNKNDPSKNNQVMKKPDEKITTEGKALKVENQVATLSSTAAQPKDEGKPGVANKNVPTPQPQQSKPLQPKSGGPKPQQIKKNPTTPKKTNVVRTQNTVPNTPQSLQPAATSKVEMAPHDKNIKDERKRQMDLQRKQAEEERRKHWHLYFLAKPHDLLTLDRNKVIVLKSVDKGRPQAQFVCKVCNYYCDNISVVAAHIRKSTHQRQLQDYNDETTLREMPNLTSEQLSVLNSYLLKVVACEGLSPSDLETRRTIGVLVSDIVTSNLKGCSTRLFGSSIHGLGLKTSDVNIDLQVPEGSLPPTMLKEVAALLRKSPHFVNISENFDCEFPFVSFRFKQSGERCSISLNNERAVNLAILLSKYTPLDPRLMQLSTLFRLWGQVTETDKPQEGTWPGYAFYLMTIFYLQQCTDHVLPVLNDLLVEKGESESANTVKVLSMNVSDIKSKWKTNNKQNLASLWLGLLKFFTVDFDYSEYIVSIDSSTLVPRKTRKLFIVDPFLPTRNVARSVTSNAMFYYIMGCLMTTCRYFGLPQTKQGPLFGEIYTPATKYHHEHESRLQIHDQINSKLVHLLLKLDAGFKQQRVGIQESITEVLHLMQNHKYQNIDNIPVAYLDRTCIPPRQLFKNMAVSPSDAKLLVSSFFPRGLEYDFCAFTCTGGQKVPRICSVCKTEGHLKDSCPEEKLPPLDVLAPLSPEHLQVLDNLCMHIFEKWKQSDEDISIRESICQELQDYIGKVNPTVQLKLFGSTKNGFGLKGSDMDICLVFEDNKTGEGLNSREFIEVLYRLLRSFKGVQDLLAIATAKVPIVKFTHKATKLDGDISLYNVLAMENSRLLCTYANIDIRARILGYMMKRFSKICRIGDASKGSLSSYAYTLLVIFFLQRCNPPVLPVLQELTEDVGLPPKNIVEGCNAYFFNDLTKLDNVWSGHGLNKQSVGQLWLDLLIFYTEKFDLLNHVVCIRSGRPVTKFEKLWISKGIAIEDPFDLSHNLGSALTRKMSLYIIKAFRKGRNHFGHPLNLSSLPRDIEVYYLNVKALTDGEPPNDRGCRFCKSIGHKERDCPEKKKRNRVKQSRKNEDTPKKDFTPARKLNAKKMAEDDDDDDEEEDDDLEGESESGEESIDLEDQLTEALKISDSKTGNSPKSGAVVNAVLKTGNPTFVSNKVHSNEKGSIVSQLDRRNHNFHSAPPGFSNQGQKMVVGTQLNPLKSNEPPRTPHQSQRNHKHQPLKTVINSTAMAPTSIPNAALQSMNSSDQAMHIPTIIFSNSKIVPEQVQSGVPLPRYVYPSTPETPRPPPGFIPLVQNGRQQVRFPVPHPLEQKPGGQNTWPREGVPFIPNMDYMRVGPFGSPVSVSTSATTPRTPVGHPFTYLSQPMDPPIMWSANSPSTPIHHPMFPQEGGIPLQTLDSSIATIRLNTVPNVVSLPPNSPRSNIQHMPVSEHQLPLSSPGKKDSL